MRSSDWSSDVCASDRSDLIEADHAGTRATVAEALAQSEWPSEAFNDAERDTIREQFRRFTEAEILPHAHAWHLANALIPDATVNEIGRASVRDSVCPYE